MGERREDVTAAKREPRCCAKCGEPIRHDGFAFTHTDPARVYGHVADPGEAYRAQHRAAMDALRKAAVNAMRARGEAADG